MLKKLIILFIAGLIFISIWQYFQQNKLVKELNAKDELLKIKDVKIILNDGGRVDWCPILNVIVFDKKNEDGYHDVFISDLNGMQPKCLTCNKEGLPELNNGNPSCHPSGKFIAFLSQDPYLVPMMPGMTMTELKKEREMKKKENRKSSAKSFLTEKAELQKELEKFINGPIIGVNNNIWIMDSEGKKFWQITHIKQSHGTLNPHFSPDGSKLIWSEIAEIPRRKPPVWSIKIADVKIKDGKISISNVATLRPNNMQIYKTHGFSPDSKFILFSAAQIGKFYNNMAIYKMELKKGKVNPIKLTNDDDWNDEAKYTPDGNYILWASNKDIPQPKKMNFISIFGQLPKFDYWIMNSDGSHKKPLSFFNSSDELHQINISFSSLGDFAFGPNHNLIIASASPKNSLKESIILFQLLY